ncbi:DUF6320 domain-containing protein [Caproicibacterium sp. BJN0003]|uniref:DUF6320 domain-containing protein n=1 Tax=Caproicibacterium sp. BJN0003 TaxID=2994078 RepID=UPI00225AD87C|nr:DUF6320 domain-containing protein [Caproicibacterium sp. BJN0003]UZT81851.1 DUF6320 domain-containing protein [Caproicibacterium sp. BJN0003]
MKYCERCNLKVRGNLERCPLCQGLLKGEGSENPFPFVLGTYQKNSLFFRILLLCTITIGIVSVAVNFLLPKSGKWSLFVIAGIGCFWLNLVLVMYKRRNIFKTFVWELFLISALCVLWDFATGWNRWSLNYAVPILCMAVMATLTVTARIFGIAPGSFLIYLCLVLLLNIAMFVSLLMGLVMVALPTVLSVCMNLVLLTALLIFRGREMLAELHRRLHM